MQRKKSRSKRSRRPFRAALICAAIVLVLLLLAWYQQRAGPPIVARVLFSETANCSPAERLLVAGVMKNRINHIAFGRLPSLAAVAAQPGAFSCVNDNANTNWRKTRYPLLMSASEKRIWNDCLALAAGDIPPALGPSGRPLVYYHDKSIRMPASWTNSQWHAIEELTTPHFVFYSIVPARK